LEMVGLLKSCTAFEAYCQVYKASLQPEHILEFLLLNAEFPRSVRFAVEVVQSTLKAISSATETGRAGRAERVAGRLRAALAYAQVDEIVADSLRTFLEDIQKKCGQIHAAIHHTYVDYPIEMEI
jgi:uncharacterized alpha-E superfamily protein